MRRLVSGWAESAGAFGSALLAVWRAEVEALKSDLIRSGHALRGGLILMAVAAGVAFWTLGLGLWTLVEALATWLPRWGAVATVFGAGLLATLVLALLGRRRLGRVEAPLALVKRRGREHADWWRDTVMPGSDVDASASGAGEKRFDPELAAMSDEDDPPRTD